MSFSAPGVASASAQKRLHSDTAGRAFPVRDGELHEIKSPLILQPGPAALTDGLDALHHVLRRWAERHDAARVAR